MHVTDRDLTLYVSAQLPPPRMLWLESHCEVCESCANAVCEEAKLELQLRAWVKEEHCGRRVDELRCLALLAISENDTTAPPESNRSTLDDTSARPSTSLPRNSFALSSSMPSKLLQSPFTPSEVEVRRSLRPSARAQVLQTLFLFGSMVFAMVVLMSSHLEQGQTLSPLSQNQTWLSDAGDRLISMNPNPSTGEIGISGGTP